MGMSASQARLLSITARLSDNELRSQTITTAKSSLSTLTSQASAEYLKALDETQMFFSSYDTDGNKVQEKLTATCLTLYSPLKNQYAIVNSDGQAMVSELDATNYLESATLGEFLEKYGVATVEDKQVDNPKYIQQATYIYGNDWQTWLDGGTGTKGGLNGLEPMLPDYNKVEWVESTNDELYQKFLKGQGSCGGAAQGGDWTCYLHVLTHLLDQEWNRNSTPYNAANYPGKTQTTTGTPVNIDYKYISGAGISQTEDLIPVSSAIVKTSGSKTYYAAGTMGADLKPDATEKERLLSDYYYDENGVLQKKLLKDKIIDMYYVLEDHDQGRGNGKNLLGTTDAEVLALYQSFQEDMKLKEKTPEWSPDEEAWKKDHDEWQTKMDEELAKLAELERYLTDDVITVSDKDQAQWYVNLWHRMNGASDYKVEIDGVDNGAKPDKHYIGQDEEAEKYADMESNLANGLTENGKILWTVLEDGLMNSQDWLKYGLTNRLVTLERVNFTEPTEDGSGLEQATWTSIIYSNALDISEEENDKAITAAEVKYKQALSDIEAKDKQYDNILKRLDTEHNALQTEYDSIKGVITKNIDRTLKMYS